ncbi:unnamed protein product [Orchesella dallaii]|uniref:Uncharacterized protein n=1 Tax=Orchesella dallaii TaxID=48710 RepID=A0ABP1S8G2_9HEXA
MGGILGCLKKMFMRCGCIGSVAEDGSETDTGGMEMRHLYCPPACLRPGIGAKRRQYLSITDNDVTVKKPISKTTQTKRKHRNRARLVNRKSNSRIQQPPSTRTNTTHKHRTPTKSLKQAATSNSITIGHLNTTPT